MRNLDIPVASVFLGTTSNGAFHLLLFDHIISSLSIVRICLCISFFSDIRYSFTLTDAPVYLRMNFMRDSIASMNLLSNGIYHCTTCRLLLCSSFPQHLNGLTLMVYFNVFSMQMVFKITVLISSSSSSFCIDDYKCLPTLFLLELRKVLVFLHA